MKITGQLLHKMLVSAANALDNNKTQINNMNVYPVPDGDTGINMTLTMSSVKEVSTADGTVAETSKNAASVIIRSARGNSGAILSLFFRGMSKAFANLEEVDAKALVKAFRFGTDEAYKAVMKPTEGTILTVMRACAEEAEMAIAEGRYENDLEGFFAHIVRVANDALEKTPEQLPILKEVNVVDAGGYGFVTVLDGMLAALNNNPVALIENGTKYNTAADFSEFDTENITFTYCTECIIEKNEKYVGEGTAEEMHVFISQLGDSVVFIDDEDIIKLHVHTDHPGLVMEKALEFGAIAAMKVENMRKQHSELVVSDAPAAEKPVKIAAPTKPYGFVAVCMGEGIKATFEDLGVDTIIHGGQTMNPSTQDIIDAVNATPASTVYVLPNNKNIYMVAEQASKLIKDKEVVVLNTKSVPQGVSVLIAYNPDGTPEDNLAAMEEAIGAVTTMSVTHAVRSTNFEGAHIEDGQMLGMVDGKIECIANSPRECLAMLADKMTDASYITLFCGEELTEEEAEASAELLRKKLPSVEVAMIMGGQPIYNYIISVE